MKRLKDSSDVPEARLGILPKNIYKLKENDKATFYSPVEEWVLRAASTKEPEKREFPVDSRASMHMVSVKDILLSLETMRTSRSPTTVMTANGEVQTREEATVYVRQLDFFVQVMFLEETTALLLWRNSDSPWASREQKNTNRNSTAVRAVTTHAGFSATGLIEHVHC